MQTSAGSEDDQLRQCLENIYNNILHRNYSKQMTGTNGNQTWEFLRRRVIGLETSQHPFFKVLVLNLRVLVLILGYSVLDMRVLNPSLKWRLNFLICSYGWGTEEKSIDTGIFWRQLVSLCQNVMLKSMCRTNHCLCDTVHHTKLTIQKHVKQNPYHIQGLLSPQ